MATKEPSTADQNSKQHEQNLKLCRAIEAHPCVYDREQPYEKEECDRAWEAIASTCGERVVACKVRWRNIRTAFMRSLQTTSKKRTPNRTRDHHLQEALAFYAPHVESWLHSSRPGVSADENEDQDLDDSDGDDENTSLSTMVAAAKDALAIANSDSNSTGEKRERGSRRVRGADDELTTSADETAEDEQKSPASGSSSAKARVTSRVGTFIIPKQAADRGDGDEKEEPAEEEEEKGIVVPAFPPPTAPRLGRPPKRRENNADLEKAPRLPARLGRPPKRDRRENDGELAKAIEELEDEVRHFRFRRACKRSLDKTVVQQLRNDLDTEAKPDPEAAKRPRRSLPPRKSALKGAEEGGRRSAETTTPQQQQRQNQQQRRTPRPLVSPMPKRNEEKPKPEERAEEVDPAEEAAPETVEEVEEDRRAKGGKRSTSSFVASDVVEAQLKSGLKSSADDGEGVVDVADAVAFAVVPRPEERRREWGEGGGGDLGGEGRVEKGVQCGDSTQTQTRAFDDEFLNTLRPQMAAMNARQRLHFKQKVYRSLMEVFDDAVDFPGSPEDQQRLLASSSSQSPATATSTSSSSALSLPLPLPSAELRLIRELAALVQAAKLSPELLRATSGSGPGPEVVTPSPSNEAQQGGGGEEADGNRASSSSSRQSNIEVAKRMLSSFRFPASSGRSNEGETMSASSSSPSPSPRHVIRKVVKVGGNSCGIVTSQDGEKRRVYRILPKGVHSLQGLNVNVSSAGGEQLTSAAGSTATSAASSASASSLSPGVGVGTFIIPRAPGSIASSANLAAAVAASTSSLSPLPPSLPPGAKALPAVFRHVPASGGGTMVVSSAATTAPSSSSSSSASAGVRRMMTIRSNVRPSAGSVLPRQILRRYSICGAGPGVGGPDGGGHVSTMGVVTPPRIITTSATTPPTASKTATNSSSNYFGPRSPTATSASGSASLGRRLVRATTATPPFKMPQLATIGTGATTVTQSLGGTRATATFATAPAFKPAVKTTCTAASTTTATPTSSSSSSPSFPITIGGSRAQAVGGHPKRSLPTSAEKAKSSPTSKTYAAKIKEREREREREREAGKKTTTTASNKKAGEAPAESFGADSDDPNFFPSDDFMSISIKHEPAD